MFIATVGIWAVKNHLNRVIDYKTEQKLYVTGINCSSETAYQKMINMKKFYHKEDGILAFHAFHSYKKGEVTPELATKLDYK